jgi:hypothetical protein
MALKKDLTGLIFGDLSCLRVVAKSRNGHIRWECKCSCGRHHEVMSTHLIQGKTTHCGCKVRQGSTHQQWSGVGNISGNVFDQIRKQAKKAKSREHLEFNLSIDFLWQLFLQQNKKCALSGIDLVFEHSDGKRVNYRRTASLDRIDSSKGYTEDNVQWVHKNLNLMKNRLEQNFFIELCGKVYLFNKEKP